MDDLITVIIPVYNVEKYMRECLDSVINQSYSHLEIILVDDGSTDYSGKICDEYCKMDIRVKCIHKKNGGLSSARNAGLDIATGNYIAFIDSDDIYELNYIEILYRNIVEFCADISCCKYMRFNESKPDNINQFISKTECISSVKCMENILYQYRDHIFTVAVWNKLYKRAIFDSIRFPFGKLNEDMAVVLQIMDLAKKVVVCDYIGYFYRINSNSITNQKFSSKRMDVVYVTEDMLKYVRDKHPELENAAIHILFRRNIEMLMLILQSDKQVYINEYTYILDNIKKYRLHILYDSKSQKSSKICALVSFCGVNIMQQVYKIYKQHKSG